MENILSTVKKLIMERNFTFQHKNGPKETLKSTSMASEKEDQSLGIPQSESQTEINRDLFTKA